ncbi:MAG: hypothetical protein ACRDT6_13155 [Micromonosporaceae bacterium]
MSGLSRRWRKVLLVVHVVTSVAWIGVDLVLLALAAAGLLSSNPDLLRAGYVAMGFLADTVVVPVALTALATGVVLAVGTPWGLIRYRWVLTKFVLTMVMATAVVFALRPSLNQAAARALQVPLERLPALGVGDPGIDAMVAPSVAMALLLVVTALSVYKPWGRTRWGRRAESRRTDSRRAGSRRDGHRDEAVRQPGRPGQLAWASGGGTSRSASRTRP